MGRLIVISGPSCVGKSPLLKAVGRLRSDLLENVRPLVLYNSRSPRPGEIDGKEYHFRRREQIEDLRNREDVVVMEVRGDLQALDVGRLRRDLEQGDVLYEGNPFVGCELLGVDLVAGERTSLFVSPLSGEEISRLVDPENHADAESIVTDVMRRKLLRRTRRQKTNLSLKDLQTIERRASSAWTELTLAPRFDHVLVNHDGEDSENWDAFYEPLGDARRTTHALIAALEHRSFPAESWDQSMFPDNR